MEVLVRGGTERTVKRKGVERTLEGWSDAQGGPCELSHLQSLNAVWSRKISGGMVGEVIGLLPYRIFNLLTPCLQSTPDPTQNVSFNLNLTPSQQHSRAQVPLPYVHEGIRFTLHSPPHILTLHQEIHLKDRRKRQRQPLLQSYTTLTRLTTSTTMILMKI